MLISTASLKLNQQLHLKEKNYGNRPTGGGSAKRLALTLTSLHEKGFCNSYLDYGTGKGELPLTLKRTLTAPISISAYDPANPSFSNHPSFPHDFVTCLDVLEHIELSSVHHVLHDIKSLTKNIAFLVVDLQPAVKRLSTGQNAHVMLAPPDWWSSQISSHFPVFMTYPTYHKSGILQKCTFICSPSPALVELLCYTTQKLKSFKGVVAGGYLG
jgi:hypothetical protein